MSRLAPVLALALLATSASAQAPVPALPDLGVSLSVGDPTPETVALDQEDPFWSVQYRFENGFAVGGLASSRSSNVFTAVAGPTTGALAFGTDRVRRRIGLTAGRIVRTRLGDLRMGALAMYRYDRTTRIGYTLQEGAPSPYPSVPDSFRTLRPDGNQITEATSGHLSISSSVTASRPVRLSESGRFDPGAGVAVSATQTVSGQTPAEVGSATAFLRLPVRLSVMDRIGITLDTTLGATVARRSGFLVSFGRDRWFFYPATGAALRVDF